MKELRTHLEKIQSLSRQRHHPLIHRVHKDYRISRKTLFYIKEYGPHTHIAKTIIRESLKILLFASLISSIGGLALEHTKTLLAVVIPLTILIPTLNGMIGNFGTIISSRFSTMLHDGEITPATANTKNPKLRELFNQIWVTSFLTSIFASGAALAISAISGFGINAILALKIFLITIIDIALLIGLLLTSAIYAGLYFYKKGEDPNNFLIPLTTSIADFGNMLILALLVILMF